MPASNCHHFPSCPDDESCKLYEAKQRWHWEGEAEKSLRNPRRPEVKGSGSAGGGGFCLFMVFGFVSTVALLTPGLWALLT